jgi:large subunit ribosomal protein L18
VDKKQSRLIRARKTRARIAAKDIHRLTIHRTPRHIYAQIIAPDRGQVVVSASTLEKAVRTELNGTGNAQAAAAVGKTIAGKAAAKGVTKVAFDRSGFKYHGRVKALADAAREAGLEI